VLGRILLVNSLITQRIRVFFWQNLFLDARKVFIRVTLQRCCNTYKFLKFILFLLSYFRVFVIDFFLVWFRFIRVRLQIMKIFFSSTNIKKPLMNGKISLEELPAIANQYEFDGIDILDRYIKNADLNYIKSKTKSLGLGTVLSINTDLTVSSPKLNHQFEHFRNMLKLAKDLGASVIRFTLGGGQLSLQTLLNNIEATHLLPQKVAARIQCLAENVFLSRPVSVLIQETRGKKPVPSFDPNNCDKVVSALKNILPLVNRSNIHLAIENHWGLSTNPDNILYVLNQIDSAHIGTCPDFGNFLHTQDKYACLKSLLPKAKLVHAKSYAFDEAGEERSIDYGRCMQLMKSCNYQGDISVEYEGAGDGIKGAVQTKTLIEKHWS